MNAYLLHVEPTDAVYAWSSWLESGGTKEHFFVVLQLPPIATATDAVRNSISNRTQFKPEAGNGNGVRWRPDVAQLAPDVAFTDS